MQLAFCPISIQAATLTLLLADSLAGALINVKQEIGYLPADLGFEETAGGRQVLNDWPVAEVSWSSTLSATPGLDWMGDLVLLGWTANCRYGEWDRGHSPESGRATV